MMGKRSLGILLIVTAVQLIKVQGNGVISFVDSKISVDESSGNAVLKVKRTSGSSGKILFSCEITNGSALEDFANKDRSLVFGDADTAEKECVFTIKDDTTPEGNETFIVILAKFGDGNGAVGNPKEATITILANDKAYGVIGFSKSGTIDILETTSTSPQNIELLRSIGTYGAVSVNWQIVSGPNNGANDFVTRTGTVSFVDGQNSADITLQVKPDNIPENDEVFTIRLTSSQGGAELNSSFRDLQIRIPANDAPVRFPVSHIEVRENQTTVQVQVNRGLQIDGITTIGDINSAVDINWYLIPGNAHSGKDFQNKNGTINFSSGKTKSFIDVKIINDATPELAENFTIHLKSTSPSVYIIPDGVATVTILPNDDQHGVFIFGSFPSFLDEDSTNTGTFVVNRTAGTFGSVSVSWAIVAGSGASLANVFVSTLGVLNFNSGEHRETINVVVNKDSIPEEAAEFYVQLSNPTGGSRLANTIDARRAVFYVKDSDDAYGVVDFSGLSYQHVIRDKSPRKLSLTLNRTGGTLRSITVNYTVEYYLPGSNVPSNSLGLTPNGQVGFTAGQTNATFTVTIPSDGFIKLGSVFKVVLNNVKLEGVAPKVAPSTPRLGPNNILYLNISTSNADGEIGFAKFHQTLTVQEPNGLSPRMVELQVIRDGTAEGASVDWSLKKSSGDFTAADAGPSSGTINFKKGQQIANLTIHINPDNLPELDEVFTVTLSNVSSPNKLQTGMETATITIAKNDNPGGTFIFGNTTPLFLKEGDDFSFDVIRLGSALDKREVAVKIIPNDADFTGATGALTLTFQPNQYKKLNNYVFVKKDNTPELAEKFQLILVPSGPVASQGMLGNATTINITIEENEDPYGNVEFAPSDLVKHIDEARGKNTSVIFSVNRNDGTFGSTDVSWEVLIVKPTPGLDIHPSQGVISFTEGDKTKPLEIFVLNDVIPEGNETFIIRLKTITGKARFGSQRNATLIITKNDDPVFFDSPTLVNVTEGQVANLTISRGGDRLDSITVTYRTFDGTAMTSDLDYVAVDGEVVFGVGEKTKRISIVTRDDDKPEGLEYFTVKLMNSSGDTVIQNDVTKVTIYASDTGTGVFQFVESYVNNTVSEPGSVSFQVSRLIAQHGKVHLYYQILPVLSNGSLSSLPPGVDFNPQSGFIKFKDGQQKGTITIQPFDDKLAEMNETFAVEIVNATGIGTGENGRLGNITVQYFTVLPNDDPYGVFRFDDSSIDIQIPEDYLPGKINTTEKDIIVVRDQGLWGTTQVLWEISSADNNIKQYEQFDLLFLSNFGSGVVNEPSKRRKNTGTNVSCFSSARSGSYATVSLFGGETLDEFSMSAWLQPDKQSLGYLLSYGLNGVVELEVAINTTGSTTSVFLSLFDGNVTVDLGKDISDGNWHEIVLNMKLTSTEVTFYIDGIKISTWSSFSGRSLTGGGVFTVGSSDSSKSSYTGCVQDVRVYKAILEDSKVEEMFVTILDLTPINGYLTFPNNVKKQGIVIKSVDDLKPEDQEKFRMGLITAKGGARLDENKASTTLTVLKSDNANGLFGFESSNPMSMTETSNRSLTIERKKGTSGQVSVKWSIYKYSPSGLQLASEDFTRSQGTIVFSDGDSQEIFYIKPKDDQLPELDEEFVLKLDSATSKDGKTSSTPTSGASIEPNFTEINITVVKNDYPYGLLQFMDAVPPGNATISPAVEAYHKDVRESAGTVDLIVGRAQGTEGDVAVSWRIVPGTAKAAVDYIDSAGDLDFIPGNRSAKISIKLLDDDKPELNKTFEVVLYDPKGNAELSSLAKNAQITILPSDDAFGVMNFSQDSLKRTVNESSTTLLTILRSGGDLGLVTVFWRVTGPNSNDVDPMEGSVDLPTGKRSAQISIKIRDDVHPELSESFVVMLVNVSKGRLATTGITSNITIQASDHPYGVFQFSNTVLSTSEQNKTLSLIVERLGGSYGIVRVYYKTHNFGDSVGNFKQTARPGEDFEALSSSLEFAEGVKNATISLNVLEDDIPEDTETVLVSLSKVEIVKHSSVVPVPVNSPVLGRDSLARIDIQRNDNASGVVQLTADKVTVTEPYLRAIVNATRKAGAFGKIVIRLAVIPGTAVSSDYRIVYDNVTFQDGQTTAVVPVQIVNDNDPEKIESFTIKLLESGIQGGALLGYPKECIVTIDENDYPYGLIGFGTNSISIEAQEPSKVQLKVTRTFGTEGANTVQWVATYKGMSPIDDITPTSGDLVFPAGSASQFREKIIEIDIKPDNIPEIPEIIQITLTNVTSGKAVIDAHAHQANLTIAANDDPHGVVEFSKNRYIAIEGTQAVTLAYLEVKRNQGSFGNLRLYYSTKQTPGSNISSQDFNSVSNGSITIPEGQTTGNITINILNDTIPELHEMFSVVLESVVLVGQSTKFPPRLGALREANVTILSNDDANGRFIIRALNPDPNTGGVVKTVAEAPTSVSFEIIRTGGTIGSVTVKWNIDSSSNATADPSEPDFRGDGGTLDFLPGVTKKTVVLEILQDDIPETDEAIIIILTNPTNGATVAKGLGSNLTIIISANDKVAGLVGFSKSSQSVVTKEGAIVQLSVERTRSAAGMVRVLWTIHGKNASKDFKPSFGHVMFSQGQTKANISFQVQSDADPEPNELFTVTLTNITTYEIAASGAAELIPDQISATLSVQASDEPHGVIEFQSGSRDLTTDEANKTVTLVVSRLYGTIGSVRVNYEVKTGNITALKQGQRLASNKDFNATVGSIVIRDGQSSGQLPVQIIDESDPEIAEVFIVNITKVVLISSPHNTGMAPKLGTHRAAQVTINSNDNPRGLLGFTQTKYYVNESIGTYDVIVERTQGTLGSLTVQYYIKGNTAIEGTDFVVPANTGGDETLTFKDGERTKNITIKIKDDGIPEDDKIFRIHLKKTEDNTLRSGFTVAEVVIFHNDDGRGVFSFDTITKTISEPGNGAITSATFKVVRKVASLGKVIVGWRILNDSAASDVSPTSGNLTFDASDAEESFTITSLLDSTPEKDESFSIGLSIVSSTGGRIESPSIAILTIAENDYPYGELEILGMPSLSSSISLEENIGTFKTKVRRTKGNFGRISVTYETVQGSAKSPKGDVVYFETIQGLKTVGAETWYSFSAYGDQYLILASNSSGDKGGYSGSSLYRWQGVFTKVQSITTDGAVNWGSVVINDVTYIAVANYGEDGRTETNSNIYRLDRNGHMVSIQNISTKGASDVKFFKDGAQTYLIFANSKSNSRETVLKSKVYRWQSGSFVDQNADFETRAASGLAVFTINGDKLLAVSSFHNKAANSFVTNSPILKWQSGSFQPYKEVSTNGPIGVQYFENGGEHYLVFGNSKGPATVHQWKTDKFELVQSLATSSLKSVYAYNFDNKVQLCTVDNSDKVKIYAWDNSFQLQMNTTVQAINTAFPVVIADPVAGDVQVIAAAMSGSAVSPVLSPVKLSLSSDYVPRKGQLIFENGQTEIELDFTILQDNVPETDESFSIALSNATGKAVIGSNSHLTVTILSNDNAHGRIGFSEDSLKLTQVEENTVVNFEVVREYGQSGRVVVLWNATGDYREGQISPVSGALVFDGRESKQNISIRLQDDHIPELDKVIKIRLLTLNETGSSQPGRGAVINTARALATLTIPGNDDPYGVISWLNTYFLSQASTVINKTVTLTITRTRGLIGGVLVSYQTQAPAGPLHSNEQSAVDGVDYVSKRGQVTMAAGVNSTDIEIEVMHNHLTSINKRFVINITAVTLQPGSPPSPLVNNSPRISTQARLLEVVISQNNQSLGEINFNISSMRLQTTEGSTITLMLVRNGSVTGRVGLRYVVRPSLTHSVTPASSSDYTPENGTVYFEDKQTTRYVSINVVKDGTPELAEEFYVAIVSPINGVGIGGKRRVDVEIKPNDDPQGVFGFKVSPQDSNIVEEGSSIRLEVVREAGSYGQVDVTWRLEHSTSQLTPYNGTLTFKEGVRSQFVVLFAVDDAVPEAAQQFDCFLVAANNNAKINASRNRAAVVIKENDNPQGVISIDPSTTSLFVGEPNDQGYDGVFVIRILRKIGQIGKATVSWKITKITSSAPTASTTFNASSGNIEFTEGIKEIPVFLQVKQDPNPEEFASYLFKIDGRKGIDDNSTGVLEATINVAASDSPYGLIDFDSPWSYNVSEDIGFVNLTIRRNMGDIGRLKVNLTLSGSATKGNDFAISNTHLDFSDKERQKKVSIQIFNDESPELKETVGVRIQSVELIPTRVMNYSNINGLQPDEPPKVGNQNTVTINILKNDDAHGVIQFKDTSKTIHEEDKRVVLMLERTGGALGTVEVFFDVHNGTATFGKDYSISKGSVVFTENKKDGNITIPIIDDSDPEQQETFMVTLKSVSGGASIGTKKSANVIIVISDNPSGLLGFVNATELVLPNPNVTQSLTFGVARNGGAQGAITVKWQLMRVKPTDGNLSLDFFPKYSDTLSYNNGDKATQFLTIRLDAYKGPEPEEIYRIKLHDATGGADIDVLASNITITVQKYGFPNGIFKFKDTSHRTIDEPDTDKTRTLPLAIERTIGFEGDVKVYWKAIGASTQDLVQTEGELLFKAGVKLLNLDVVVKADDVPELSENFTIMLYKVDGGGDLDTRRQNVTVTIRANDDPHGVFKLKNGAQSLEVDVALSRTLQFTVQRDQGTFGDVTVDYSVKYSSWYPADLSGSLTVSGGAKEFTKKIFLSKSAFLDVNSRFQVTLTRVNYISGSPAVVSSPKLATSSVSEAVVVPDSAANAILRFADNSLKLAVASDNTATITVLRQGFYGDVSVTWKMGYPTDTAPTGYTAGQIEPATGSLVFNGETNNKTFTVKANPVTPDRKLVYAVHLSKTTTSSNVAANITGGPKRTAVIEYSGVIEIAPDALSLVVTEGSKVSCRVVRLFSIFGSVRVTYNALGTIGSFNMADGEFSKSFDVTAPDNNNPENDYTLFINITQVTGSDTPRLGDKTVSTVTVKDNDNANGVISFKTKTLKVSENVTSAVTHKVSLELQRTGGTLGTVSVIVRTVGGGEPWDGLASPQTLVDILDKRAKDGSAAVGKDYDQLLETVSFGPGVSSKTVQLTIRDDDVPEPDETVYVYLANVTGGAVLGTTDQSLQSWSVVTIEGNDLMNGQVGYVAGSTTATIDEDGSASATLSIERMGANFGSVTVVWRVREPSKRNQLLEYEGTAVFKPGVKEATFTIRLRDDKIPEFKDTFHVDLVELQNTQQARIDPAASSAVITVLDSDFPYGKVGFAPSALYTAVNLKTTKFSLEVLRSYGNTTDITVKYMTEMLPLKSTQLGIATSRAVVGQDYKQPTVTTLKLEKGETSAKMTLTLTPETPSPNNRYPKAFKVNIINVTNNAVIDSESSTATVIISNDEDTTRFLSLRASSRLSPLTDEAINNLLADLKIYVKKPLNGDRKTLTKDTITNILKEKKSKPLLSARKLQDISKTTLMDIFDELLHPSRSDTKGSTEFADLFDMFAFSLAYGETCPATNPLGVKGKYAYATAYRKTLNSLNGLQINSFTSDKHFFSYPSNMFIGLDNKQQSGCNDVHFIEYHNSHWFSGSVLSDKVLSTSLNDSSTINKNNMFPYTYRIYTGKKRVTPKGASCVYWDFTKKEWSTSGCSVKSDKEDYVECQCNHMSNFASRGQSDDRVGYSTYFFAACFVCLGAFALALLSHHACSVDNLFSAKLLMHMFFACMAAHLMYVVGAYVSSSQAVIAEDPAVRCSVLGMFIHYFFLCQFSWMFIQGWNLWRILVLNDEHTDRKYVLFFVLGWGMPVVAIVLYIIITQAAFSWSLHDMYGDVHKNGDMCFIPNAYAALASVVAPTLLFLMGVAVVFTQAYQVTMQWRYYDDIYRGHYNIKEVRHVILLFVLISITWLFAGLHLAYGYLWMVILFAIFDVMLGLYVFILYFILRNQVRGVFKRTYAFQGEPPPIHTHDDFFRGNMGTDSSGSRRFKRPSPEVPSDWDELDNTPRSNRKLMINMDDTGSIGQINDNFEDDIETQDFDDLIFALKTGGHFDPSEEEKPSSDQQEHFELRRISIPDTHL